MKKPSPKPAPKPQERPTQLGPKKPGKPKPKLIPLYLLLLVGVAGCETTKYRYLPTAPDTVVVRDTVIVPCEDDDDRPRWRP